MTRVILFLVGLAFAGSLLMVACDQSGDTKTPTPPPTAPKAPDAKTPAPPAPAPAPAPKPTSSAATGLPAPAAAVLSASQCAMAGCTKTGNPLKTLKLADGKTVMFCCDVCLAGYKKANNIQ